MENQRVTSLKAPVPDDWAEHAPTGSNAELKARYGVGDKTLARWRKESGIVAPNNSPPKEGREPIPLPSDFSQTARGLKNYELAEKYGVSEKVVSRWRRISGIQSPAAQFSGKVYMPRPAPAQVPTGLAAEAAQFLRPTHRPVYHRIIEGKQFEGQYVVGQNKFSEDELVEYARSKGFKTSDETLAAFSKYD